ncbi:MAG: peptidoglycan DD-metalloendopeptidase family protein [Prevotellaceae bacterium]|jgi:murein DD-endopeptidase MepM/ murein hydrolase activator NlpD|nr:peptidoglycan DD-metalloendopeptidase family protein [Prevotellaceae bacterium]
MMKYLKILSIFIVLLTPPIMTAHEITADTLATANLTKTIISLTNERDTIVSVNDTVYLDKCAIKILTKHVTQKIFDTVFVDDAGLSPEDDSADQIADDDDNIDEEFEEEDIGGGDDAETYSEEKLLKLTDSIINYNIPASDIYPFWTNSKVNPYNIDVTKLDDTVELELCDFVYPLSKPMHVTSTFGYRRGRNHNGIDLKLLTGDTVVAPMRGMIRVIGNNGRRKGYGKFIIIRHYNGLETVYGHLSKVLVENNQIVEPGDAIALGGNTGRSTGSHLHWEIRYLGHPMNPQDLIDFENHKPKMEFYCMSIKKTFEYIIEQAKARFWTIKKGDTLSKISLRTGVSIKRICALNKITTKTILRIGRKLRYN